MQATPRLQTVREDSEIPERRSSQTDIAPVGQHFVTHLRTEGEAFVQTLIQRDNQVVDEMDAMQARNEGLERHIVALTHEIRKITRLLGSTHEKYNNLKSHVEDLQMTTAAVTERLGRELDSRQEIPPTCSVSSNLSQLGGDARDGAAAER